MNAPIDIAAHCLGIYGAGAEDDAFHGLMDHGPELIPALIGSYKSAADDVRLQAFIIRVVSRYRSPAAFGFLRHALQRSEERIWKEALDGLALAGSGEAIDAMDQARTFLRNVRWGRAPAIPRFLIRHRGGGWAGGMPASSGTIGNIIHAISADETTPSARPAADC